MKTITPCLWFDTQALDVAKFYLTVFPDSSIKNIAYYGENTPGKPGSVMTVSFSLSGNEFLGLNGGPVFKMSPAISFTIPCETQEEVDHYWNALSAVSAAEQCGWVQDKFGVSWQIVPNALERLMSDPDPVKADRVMQAMLKMKKLDIAKLEEAYRG